MVAREVLPKLNIFKVMRTRLVRLNPFEPIPSSSTIAEDNIYQQTRTRIFSGHLET